MLQIGDQFDRFQIQNLIAHGGMSDIYRAYDLMNRQDVAIKIPDQSMIGDPAQYERFEREKEVLQTLHHPAVLKGLGCGQYNRIPYLVMELVEGTSLRSLIENSAPMPIEQVVPLITQIAEGMAYCHANEVIHRDLKPENIIVNQDGQPIIMDFGLALTKGAHRVTYSNLSATMGTPDYMAPEQVEGKRGDERTDVYAVGTILFEMLSGKVPFTGDNNLVVMAARLNTPAPTLTSVLPGISRQMAAVVAKSLHKDPEKRYPNMQALIDAIHHLENADLSYLDQAGSTSAALPWWKSSTVKAVGISFAILLAMVALALILQALR